MQQRQFTDSKGTEWTVWSVHLPPSPEQECPDGWLCFESRRGQRRLIGFPLDWSDLSTDELERLCQRAEAAPRRTVDESTAEFLERQDEMFQEQVREGPNERSFITPDNRIWIVSECDTTPADMRASPDGAGRGVLRFTTGETVRELSDYPEDWARYSPGRLMQLALRAEPVHGGASAERAAEQGGRAAQASGERQAVDRSGERAAERHRPDQPAG